MRKRNLIFPLVVSSSLFIPSVEPLERTTDFNSLDNENIYEAVDILIAENSSGSTGGGGGQKPGDKEATQKKRQAAQDAAKKRIEAKKGEEKKAKETTESVVEVDNKTLTAELKNLITPTIIKIINNVKNDIKQMPKLFIENETAPYVLQPFFKCVILTEKALEAKENDDLKMANTYAKLAIRSVVREKNILEKQGRQITEKSIDPNLLTNMEYSFLGINSIILDDYKNGNRYIKKALESEIQDGSNLKSLIAYTGIINGEIAQGCSDLADLIIEGTIERVDLDIIQKEDICRFPNY